MNLPVKPVKRWAEWILLLFTLVTIVLVYFYVASPAFRDMVQPHQCLFSEATGLLCPACGGTRAIIHLLDGQLILALKSNLLAVLILPVIAYGTFTASRLVFDRNFGPSDIKIAPFWLWSLLAALLIFWIIRNLPHFSFLGPL